MVLSAATSRLPVLYSDRDGGDSLMEALLLFLDNEYMFMDLERKLSKYFSKDWRREMHQVSWTAGWEGSVRPPGGLGLHVSELGAGARTRHVVLEESQPGAILGKHS